MATGNVQGSSKMQEIIKEMEQLRINIASITEIKKKGSRSEVIETVFIFIAASQKKTEKREEFLY
jgi:hypothetical protein